METIRSTRQSLFCCFTILIIASQGAAAAQAAADKIEPILLTRLIHGETANIMISFEDTSAIIESVQHAPDASPEDKANAVQQALEAHRAKTQAGVTKLLNEKNVKFEEFWINNKIAVKNANKEITLAIAEDPEVTEIREDQVAHLAGEGFEHQLNLDE